MQNGEEHGVAEVQGAGWGVEATRLGAEASPGLRGPRVPGQQ